MNDKTISKKEKNQNKKKHRMHKKRIFIDDEGRLYYIVYELKKGKLHKKIVYLTNKDGIPS